MQRIVHANSLQTFPPEKKRFWDIVIGLLFILSTAGTALVFSQVYIHALENPLNHPYPTTLNIFYPAIFFAGGHGLGTTDPASIAGLEDFLLQRSPSFDLANIPPDITLAPTSTPFELTHIYHIYLVGIFWYIFGVSIGTLTLYSTFLYTVSILIVYGILRLGISRLWSFIGVLVISSSPALLSMSHNLRDFGKTPFILFCIWVILRLIVSPITRNKLLLLSLGLGVALGFGFGFRQDMLICPIPVTIVILFFTRFREKTFWGWRCIAVLLLFLGFVPLSLPVFKGAALEGNQASVHGFFQGISPDTESVLHFGGASYVGLYWTDVGLYGQANVLARRLGDTSPMINPHTAEYRHVHGDGNGPRLINPGLYFTGSEYARYARLLAKEVVWHFPADLVARAWNAVAALYQMSSDMAPGVENVQADFPQWLTRIFSLHRALSRFISHWGILLTLLFTIVLSARCLKIALGITGVLLYFSGYPSIFFEYRHIVYLMFVPVGVILVWIAWFQYVLIFSFSGITQRLTKGSTLPSASPCPPIQNCASNEEVSPSISRVACISGRGIALLSTLQHSIRLNKCRQEDDSVCTIFKSAINMTLFVLLLILAITVPLLFLRSWQSQQVHLLAERLAATSKDAIDVNFEAYDSDNILVRPANTLPGLVSADTLPPGETVWEYLAAVFDTQGFDIPVTLAYETGLISSDSTQTVVVYGSYDNETGRVTFYFPVYEAHTLYSPQLMVDFLESVNIPALRACITPDLPIEQQDFWKRIRFAGIVFPASFKEQFRGLYRVHCPDDLLYLPLIQIPDERANMRTFKSGCLERTFRLGILP